MACLVVLVVACSSVSFSDRLRLKEQQKARVTLNLASFCLACTVEIYLVEFFFFFYPVLASYPKAWGTHLQHATFLNNIQDTKDLGVGDL